MIQNVGRLISKYYCYYLSMYKGIITNREPSPRSRTNGPDQSDPGAIDILLNIVEHVPILNLK